MTLRMHLFRDDIGAFRLGDWHLMIVRVSEPDDGIRYHPPDAQIPLVLHISARDRSAVIANSMAITLHEVLKRREGAEHRCAFCEPLSPSEERPDADLQRPPRCEASDRSSGCEPTKGGA